MNTSAEHRQDPEEVRIFFNYWASYRKVVDADYMWHAEAYAALASALDEIREPFSFLDLGSGDACWTSRILKDRKLSRYEALDICRPALELARKNTEVLDCPREFIQADFFTGLPERMYDVIFIGMSLHHLPLTEKIIYLPEIRRRLNPGGKFVLYEMVSREEETRAEVFSRWWAGVRRNWIALNPEELERVREHVSTSDYQETIPTYLRILKEGGFRDERMLFADPEMFYAVVEAKRE